MNNSRSLGCHHIALNHPHSTLKLLQFNIEYLEFTTTEMTSMMKEKRMNCKLKNDKLQYLSERTPSATNVQSPLYVHHS